MIKVIVLKDSTDSGNVTYRGIVMKGHVGYVEEGEDIVYAAVSASALNSFNPVETFVEDESEDGVGQENMQFEFHFTSEINPRSKLPMNSLILGLQNTEKDYGKSYINVKYKEM